MPSLKQFSRIFHKGKRSRNSSASQSATTSPRSSIGSSRPDQTITHSEPIAGVNTVFNQPESQETHKGFVGGNGWEALKTALKIFKEACDFFPPVKGPVAGIIEIMNHIQASIFYPVLQKLS